MSQTHQYLQTKFQIGSCKGRIDYADSERVFHPSDMPMKAKQSRAFVQQLKRSHKLESNPPWAQTTVPGKYWSGAREMPWDVDSFESRYYAKQETEERLKREGQYKSDLINNTDDPKAVCPKWNATAVLNPTQQPPIDRYFSQLNHRAVDGSRSLRLGNDSYVAPPPEPQLVASMSTLTGNPQLGTGQPIMQPYDPNPRPASNRRVRSAPKLPAGYVSLRQQEKLRMQKLRAERAQAREIRQVELSRRPEPARTFEYPDVPNFGRTKVDRAPTEEFCKKYTADALTQYLERMDRTLGVEIGAV
jgi:hypothetical protein